MKQVHNFGFPLLALLIFGYVLISLNSYFIYEASRYIAYPKITPWIGIQMFFLISLLLALYSFGSTISSFFFGGLSDQIGRRKVFLITLAIWAGGYLLGGIGAIFTSLVVVFIGQFFCGFGDSFRTLAFSSIADLYVRPIDRMRAFGIFSSTDGVLAAGFYILDFSLRHPDIELIEYPILPFLSTALIGVLVWLIFYLNFTEKRKPVVIGSWRTSLKGFGDVFKIRGIVKLFILYVIAVFPYLTLEEVHGAYLYATKNITSFDVTLLYILMGLCWFLASCFLFPWSCKKIAVAKIFFYAFVGYLLFWLIVPWIWMDAFLYLIPPFTGLALGLFWPSILGMVSLLTPPEHQGKAQSVCFFIFASSTLLGPIIFRNDFLASPKIFYFVILICTAGGALISSSLRNRKIDMHLEESEG